MKNTYVFEIDNVIADTSARHHLIDAGWAEYHAASSEDKPNDDVVSVLRSLSLHGYEILIVTARPAKHDVATIRWLNKHDIPCDELLCRQDNDYRSELEVKLGLLDNFFGSRQNALDSVVVAFDQKEKIIEEFRNAGFSTWSVR